MRSLAPLCLFAISLLASHTEATPKKRSRPTPEPVLSQAELHEALTTLSEALRGAQVTWHVQDLKSGAVYSSRSPDQLMHPASTNKLATTAVALDTLGAQYKYTTRLWASPPLSPPPSAQATSRPSDLKTERVVADERPPITLYWEASGDPKITKQVFQGWVKSLQAQGVTRVSGLVIDGHQFTDQPLAPGYERAPEDDAAYRAAAGAVGFDFNRLVVRVRPGKVGRAPRVSLIPPIPSARVVNTANTTKTGREQLSITLHEQPDEQVLIEVKGSIPRYVKKKRFKGISVARRAPFPTRFAGEALLTTLAQAGIKLSPKASVTLGRLPPKKERSLLLTHRSPALSKLLHDINTYSNNFMAEQTLLTLGLHKGGFGGWREGVEFVRKALKARFKLSGFDYVNGSGLFGDAGFSARQLTSLLRRADQLSRGRFAKTLPRSQREGTIRRRFKALPRGAVRAKTGTLDGVSTLCGYLSTRQRQPLTFCVMMAGFHKDLLKEARETPDRMVQAMWRLKNPNPPKRRKKRSKTAKQRRSPRAKDKQKTRRSVKR